MGGGTNRPTYCRKIVLVLGFLADVPGLAATSLSVVVPLVRPIVYISALLEALDTVLLETETTAEVLLVPLALSGATFVPRRNYSFTVRCLHEESTPLPGAWVTSSTYQPCCATGEGAGAAGGEEEGAAGEVAGATEISSHPAGGVAGGAAGGAAEGSSGAAGGAAAGGAAAAGAAAARGAQPAWRGGGKGRGSGGGGRECGAQYGESTGGASRGGACADAGGGDGGGGSGGLRSAGGGDAAGRATATQRQEEAEEVEVCEAEWRQPIAPGICVGSHKIVDAGLCSSSVEFTYVLI